MFQMREGYILYVYTIYEMGLNQLSDPYTAGGHYKMMQKKHEK